MNTTTRLLLILLLTLESMQPVSSQTPQQKNDSQPTRDTGASVMLDVLVRHRSSGKAVVGLNKQDFSVYEADVKQEIEEFTQAGSPASIVLLLDVSGSMDAVGKRIREGASSAWRQFGPDDEVAIMTFAKSVEVVQGFTRDKQLIVDRIGRVYAVTTRQAEVRPISRRPSTRLQSIWRILRVPGAIDSYLSSPMASQISGRGIRKSKHSSPYSRAEACSTA